jgi:hypothetical protein
VLSANCSADHEAFGSPLRAGCLADTLELDGARPKDLVALAARRLAQTVW